MTAPVAQAFVWHSQASRSTRFSAVPQGAAGEKLGWLRAARVIFFHGLGLSHMDLEQATADGRPNTDWVLQDGMVAPVHLLYPGGEHERMWLEEVIAVSEDGGRPLFSWGFEPLTGR
jgi:hypothetical protein